MDNNKFFTEIIEIDEKTGERLDHYLADPPASSEEGCTSPQDLPEGHFNVMFQDKHRMRIDLLNGKDCDHDFSKIPDTVNAQSYRPYLSLQLLDEHGNVLVKQIDMYFYVYHYINYNGVVYGVIFLPKPKPSFHFACSCLQWETEGEDVMLPDEIGFSKETMLSTDDIRDLLFDLIGWYITGGDVTITDGNGKMVKRVEL